MSQVATAFCLLFIVGLFWLNYDNRSRTSTALWIPVVWFLIVGSRNISEWINLGVPMEDGVDRYLEGSPADRNTLALLILGGALVLAARSSRLMATLKANLPIVLYFMYCGLSIAWSDYPQVGLKRWFRSLGDLIMVLVVLTDMNPIGAMKRVLSRVGFLLLPLSILFIRYYPELGRAYGRWDGKVYWTGVTGGKNGLGMICLVYGLAAGWQFLASFRSPGWRSRCGLLAAQGLLFLMSIYLLWISDSKTSLASFVLVAGLLAAVSLVDSARKPAVLTVMVLAVVAIPFAVLFLGLGTGTLTSLGRDSTLTGRTDIWRIALQFTVNPITGAGYESFWLGNRLLEIARLNNAGLTQAHNGYLEVYLNLGWIGIALLFFLFVSTYRKLLSGAKHGHELSALLLAFLCSAVVYNYAEGAFKMMSSVWISLLFAAVGSSAFSKTKGVAKEIPAAVSRLGGVPESALAERRRGSRESSIVRRGHEQREMVKVDSVFESPADPFSPRPMRWMRRG